jgi:hypothetical protein
VATGIFKRVFNRSIDFVHQTAERAVAEGAAARVQRALIMEEFGAELEILVAAIDAQLQEVEHTAHTNDALLQQHLWLSEEDKRSCTDQLWRGTQQGATALQAMREGLVAVHAAVRAHAETSDPVQLQLLPQLLLLSSPLFGALHLRDLLSEESTEDEQQVATGLLSAIGADFQVNGAQDSTQQPSQGRDDV